MLLGKNAMEANVSRRKSDHVEHENWYKYYHLMHSVASKSSLPTHEIGTEMVAALFQKSSLSESLHQSLDLIRQYTNASGACLYLLDNCSKDLVHLDSIGMDTLELALLSTFSYRDDFNGCAYQTRHITRKQNLGNLSSPELGTIPCAISIPLIVDGRCIGMADLVFSESFEPDKDYVKQLKKWGSRVSASVYYGQYVIRVLQLIDDSALENSAFSDSPAAYSIRSAAAETLKQLEIEAEELNERLIAEIEVLKSAELIDQLSSLFSEQHLSERLSAEVNRENRTKRGLSIITIGIDNLDKLSSRYGEVVAEEIVGNVGDVVRHQIRETDAAFRLGDNTVSILLRDTEEVDALPLVNRIQSQLSSVLFMPTQDSIEEIQASFGVAQFRNRETNESLTHRARHAMGIAQEKQPAKYSTYSDIENEIINQLKLNRSVTQAMAG